MAPKTPAVSKNPAKKTAAVQTADAQPQGTTKPKNEVPVVKVQSSDDPKAVFPEITGEDGRLILKIGGKKYAYDREGAAWLQRRVGAAIGSL